MSIDHSNLLTLAEELTTGANETHWRCSIGRAYYAAFHGCQEWHTKLPMPGIVINLNAGVHQRFIDQLRNPAPEVKGDTRLNSQALAKSLGALKAQRHKADYSLGEDVDAAAALGACFRAKEILART